MAGLRIKAVKTKPKSKDTKAKKPGRKSKRGRKPKKKEDAPKASSSKPTLSAAEKKRRRDNKKYARHLARSKAKELVQDTGGTPDRVLIDGRETLNSPLKGKHKFDTTEWNPAEKAIYKNQGGAEHPRVAQEAMRGEHGYLDIEDLMGETGLTEKKKGGMVKPRSYKGYRKARTK